MNIHLTVVADFGRYKRGDVITDAYEIEMALASHPNNVVRVNQPDMGE